MTKFFKTDKTRIISPQGLPVYMRGVNVGGWLMMEGYFMHAPSLAVAKFKKEFAQALGAKALLEFENSFHDTFIREDDFKSGLGNGFKIILTNKGIVKAVLKF